jgi:DNA-binding transcriptional ArsR family regulator
MAFTIEVRFHPLYELLNSLLVFSHPSFYKKTDMGLEWRKSIIKKIGSDFTDLLNPDHVGLLSDYIFTQPVSTLSIDQWLEELIRTNMYEVMDHLQNLSRAGTDKYSSFVESYEKTLQLVMKWKEEYFDQLDPAMISTLEEDCLQKKEQVPHYTPLDFIEKVTNGFVLTGFDDVQKIILHPAFHSSPIVTFAHYEHLHFYGYPVDISPITAEEPTSSLLQKGIALSDKNRLKILRFLGNEEKSFTDIVKFIGLAKSTVHHHMVLLRASGLVQIILSPTATERYRLREQGLETIFQNYHQYLFSV